MGLGGMEGDEWLGRQSLVDYRMWQWLWARDCAGGVGAGESGGGDESENIREFPGDQIGDKMGKFASEFRVCECLATIAGETR